MKKPFYNFSIIKINRGTFSIVLKKGSFYEIVGSYSPAKGRNNFELIFLDRERLFFWFVKGVGCELPVYQFLKILLTKEVKLLNYNNKYKL
jgi:ribosomal protein S16